MTNKKGFTIIEIVVTLFIVMAALAIGYYTFVKVLRLSIYHSSTQKSQINRLMGTALLRYDCEMAGYGLTQSIPKNVDSSNYEEANPNSNPASNFNNAPYTPLPFQIGSYKNASYLVIRSTIANINDASRKWSILYYDKDSLSWKIQGYDDDLSWPKSEQDYHFNKKGSKDDDYYVIILHEKDLYAKQNGFYKFKLGMLPQNANIPPSGYTYIVYGVDSDTQPRMPFNRVDYYLDDKNKPTNICAPNTFELYRATINQSNGKANPQPLLDCITKFEVALKSGNVWYTRNNPLDLNSSLNVQEVRIFIVQQSGKFDPSYTNTSPITLGDKDTGVLGTFEPTGDQVHYQWKLITLSVRPRNLVQ